MHISPLAAVVVIPALVLAQSDYDPDYSDNNCSSDDTYCQLTAQGFVPAAASYILTEPDIAQEFTGTGFDFGPSTLAPSAQSAYEAYVSEHTGVTSRDQIESFYSVIDSFLVPSSVLKAINSANSVVQSLQKGGHAASAPVTTSGAASGATSGNGSSMQRSGSTQAAVTGSSSGHSGSAQATTSSHAGAAVNAKPTDVALMAMAGVAAGVAGLAFGL